MERLHVVGPVALLSLTLVAIPSRAQTDTAPASANSVAAQSAPASQSVIPPPGHSDSIPANAPRMSKQTRLEIIRDFETQMVYARTLFPMGTKGLKLKDGATSPSGQDLQQLLALWGPSIKPGDPAHISYVRIYDDHIHFDLNGGAIHRKKWYQHIQIEGANGNSVPLSNDNSVQNPHGSYLDVYFDKHVPEMSAAQLRDLLYPALDFQAKNKEEAYLDTVPPKVKEAIKAHHVLVGMNTEMVLHAVGKPPRKVREKDGEIAYEEWIYGQPPQDVDFVRIVTDEVVRIETMKVGGQKIVRNDKEIILEKPDKDKDAEAKSEPDIRPANAPSLRRPGEDAEDVPQPANGAGPMPIPQPPPPSNSPGPPSPNQMPGGPGDIVGSRR